MKNSIESLPPISEMMRASGLEPKKSFGQNFLFDLNLTNKIARSVPDIENIIVIEVGPGPGGLTRSLLMAGAPRVIAIEKDKTTEPILSKISDASDGRLEIIFDDALRVFRENKLSGINAAICSNLPYNIGTELLIQWLHYVSKQDSSIQISSMTLMFQREVAERIIAHVGDKQYGRLAVLVSLVADAKILFNVPNTAFVPQPKVQSAIVQVIPNLEKIKALKNLSKIEELTAKLFGQRRKMIRGIIPNFDWVRFGLMGTERAEELSPQKFSELASNE
ncbi:MAG: 16S rRNA (adenine(1518)-N(6)/adenine(1519)-N(6))-dimethyltransferase RsmA [Alphaproteobacteria bacterium]|nr:16S rRNA (adenine(1518)-N(6)/adenine(1519)-N(6))-dimethyltransferase RsmA [Alphaproteobacteria bacterium]MBN2675493.1 16S rRNA (adenine(1518)-N(6)/adenine(1519)-N(6))-dimethyltransferase RsmA [Alphaproteobacteria bacterium]